MVKQLDTDHDVVTTKLVPTSLTSETQTKSRISYNLNEAFTRLSASDTNLVDIEEMQKQVANWPRNCLAMVTTCLVPAWLLGILCAISGYLMAQDWIGVVVGLFLISAVVVPIMFRTIKVVKVYFFLLATKEPTPPRIHQEES